MAEAAEHDCRLETITAALICLMSHYARSGCPRLATCVSRHMQFVATHRDADPALRDICAALQGPWQQLAAQAARSEAAWVH